MLRVDKLAPQVDAMGRALARRASEVRQAAQRAQDVLQSLGVADDDLRTRIERAGPAWAGARPSDEPINTARDAPAPAERAMLFGADGSQVYPNRHGVALYYVINVGSLAMAEPGGATAPVEFSQPRILFDDDDLYLDSNGLISTPLIDGQRDVAELAELARLAQVYADEPRLALVDNGLMLWLAIQARDTPSREVEAIRQAHIAQLTALRDSGACLAGFVGSPRNANVVRLLELAAGDEGAFRRLSDRAVFDDCLRPGQRSALFKQASPRSAIEQYRSAGHEIYFFYLNVGGEGRAEIARVEVPEWVARDADRLRFVHAAIVENCRILDGFPYVLARAHQLAVIAAPERSALEEMVAGSMARQGMRPRLSQKALTKLWGNARRPHRL